MSPAFALARQLVWTAVQDRLPALVPLFLVVVAVAAPIVSDLALGGPDKVLRDVGLTLLWLAGSAAAVWLGVRAIGADLRDGTGVLWLHRPIARGEYVLGRFLGVVVVLGLLVAALVATWIAVAAWHGAAGTAGLLWYAVLLWAELVFVAAWAMLLSSLVAPLPAALATTGLWAAGHLADEYGRLAASADSPVTSFLFGALYLVVPDLDLFVVQDRVVHQLPIDPAAAVWACAYGAAWTGALLVLTSLVLARRDIA